jgi:hypothetical protein
MITMSSEGRSRIRNGASGVGFALAAELIERVDTILTGVHFVDGMGVKGFVKLEIRNLGIVDATEVA